MTAGISHPFKVVIHGAMPALAWIWLRNNQVAYEITYGFEHDGDDQVTGERIVVHFCNAEQAAWFALKWTK